MVTLSRGDFTLLLSEQVIRESRKRMDAGTELRRLWQFLADCPHAHSRSLPSKAERRLSGSDDVPIRLPR